MEPTLHHPYTVDEAVAAFGGTGEARFLCDGQFIVLPKVVLCMVTVGGPATQSFLGTPESVVWKPARLDYDPADEFPWLPTPAREVWGPDRQKVKQHQMFLRRPGDERFFYAGEAHLGSYGGRPGELCAGFSLYKKLPREAWLRLGGYPGWQVEVNHQTRELDPGDLPAFRQLLDELSRSEFSHLGITRYEQDSLTLHTNARRGWLMYLRGPSDSGLYTQDPQYTGDPEAEEVFQCVCGIDLEFPAIQTLPRERAIRVAEEFFITEELPRSVDWSKE